MHEGQCPKWLSLAALYRVAEDGAPHPHPSPNPNPNPNPNPKRISRASRVHLLRTSRASPVHLLRISRTGGREYISRPIDAAECSWVSTDRLPAELWSAML